MQTDRKSQDVPESMDIGSVEFIENADPAIAFDLRPDRRGPGCLSHSFRTTWLHEMQEQQTLSTWVLLVFAEGGKMWAAFVVVDGKVEKGGSFPCSSSSRM
jgi:hypothetical protein